LTRPSGVLGSRRGAVPRAPGSEMEVRLWRLQ
jgi:hypothetical protein